MASINSKRIAHATRRDARPDKLLLVQHCGEGTASAMASLISVHCCPLLRPSSISARTPVPRRVIRRGTRRPLRRCLCSQYADERQPPDSPPQLERLFSNLNQATMEHEPGSLTSAIFLVAGTTVGAGILAIPAVTQEAGFLTSAVTCISCWLYMVIERR